ncbi:MAG: fucose isomerase [Lachnospiraceae bacterium]|nr:fucose isomerase [Lachnospiraceae bacterium]
MLKGIPTQISPELLKVLDEMGHTDELVIADGNFPGHTMGKRVIRADGMGVPELLDAILKLFPLDTYPNSKGEEDPPCTLMALEPGDVGKVDTPIWDEYKKIVAKYDDRGADAFQTINKWKFYDQTRAKASVIIQTTETAIYANIILRKGVVIL